MPDVEEEAIRPKSPRGDAPGPEGPLRTDMGALEASLPSLVDRAIGRPATPARNGSDAFVFLPLDAHSRLWAQAPRPPVTDAQSAPDS